MAALTVLAMAMGCAAAAMAQTNPAVGTWKLNLAKSTYPSGTAPKSLTRIVQVESGGTRSSYDGVAADGSQIAYSFTTNYDGKDVPVNGVGQANGADMISVTRVDANTTSSLLKRNGKIVSRNRTVVSKDGKMTTITARGVDMKGKPRNAVSVFDKQ